MARSATGDLSRELGTDIQLEDLHPKAFIRKHLLSEEDEDALRKPLQGVYDGLRSDLNGVHSDLKDVDSAADVRARGHHTVGDGRPAESGAGDAQATPPARLFDADAT
jgi:sec-independent protein translocase protein TatB